MFRVRRIYDDVLPINQTAIGEVQQLLADQFLALAPEEIATLPEKLRNPFRQRFRMVLYVAENSQGRVIGFAIVLHEPVIGFCFLDFLAAGKRTTGRGVGAAFYEHVRDEALGVQARALVFECLPDEPSRCLDTAVRKQNAARLRFYEQYGARPIVETAYETPVPGGDSDNVPHLMFDGLDHYVLSGEQVPLQTESPRQSRSQGALSADGGDPTPLRAVFLRQVVQAVLERKYADLCPPDYVRKVVASFQDPLRRREYRYRKTPIEHRTAVPPPPSTIPVTMNDRHEIHHIRERGYVEAPARIRVIGGELSSSHLIEVIPVKAYSMDPILAVHDHDFVDYLERACENTPAGKSVYPYVFPIRNATRPPKELSIRAGYYCIDTFTPIHQNAFPAARRAVDSAADRCRTDLARRPHRLCVGSAAGTSCGTALLRWFLLFQQCGRGCAFSESLRNGGDPGH